MGEPRESGLERAAIFLLRVIFALAVFITGWVLARVHLRPPRRGRAGPLTSPHGWWTVPCPDPQHHSPPSRSPNRPITGSAIFAHFPRHPLGYRFPSTVLSSWRLVVVSPALWFLDGGRRGEENSP